MANFFERRIRNDERKHRLNREIMAPEVRVNGPENEPLGVMTIMEALRLAGEQDVDLVEIAPTADPPVCRLMDYGKFKYAEAKKAAEAKAKQHVVDIKEIKFRPGTDDGDYAIKLRNMRRFLEDGDKCKVTLRYRGREITHQEIGMRLLERVRDDLADVSLVENMPKLEGRQMIMVLAPKKRK
ncbi:translation initiation factor IF-3 [Piscinibacter sp. Jin2]|uniref:Translation initiation factor IF-3 n=1 Tax=Aquariibacter lacus TaxID=2801332 RepID=A0A9X0XE39_9BURK|nr:translation initiation factor IF-3 [Piscinibacter lacus]